MWRVNRFILLFSLIGLSVFPLAAQVLEQSEEAFSQAQAGNKPVLLVFAGSDWCAPCMRFEKQVLQTGAFQTYMQQSLVVLRADFPQRKKISHALRQQNDALAAEYNPTGEFPYLVLLRADRSVVTVVPYHDEPVQIFMAHLNALIDHERASDLQTSN